MEALSCFITTVGKKGFISNFKLLGLGGMQKWVVEEEDKRWWVLIYSLLMIR